MSSIDFCVSILGSKRVAVETFGRWSLLEEVCHCGVDCEVR